MRSKGLEIPSELQVEGQTPKGKLCMHDGLKIVGLPNTRTGNAEPHIRQIKIKNPVTGNAIVTIRVRKGILRLVEELRKKKMTGEQIAEELVKKPVSEFYDYEIH